MPFVKEAGLRSDGELVQAVSEKIEDTFEFVSTSDEITPDRAVDDAAAADFKDTSDADATAYADEPILISSYNLGGTYLDSPPEDAPPAASADFRDPSEDGETAYKLTKILIPSYNPGTSGSDHPPDEVPLSEYDFFI